MSTKTFENTVVRLADLAVTDQTISGFTFRNCQIMGPAVVFLNQTSVVNSAFDAPDANAILWIIDPEARPYIVGAIAAVECLFEECRFQGVGFAVTEEDAEMFRDTPVVG